MNKQSFIDLKNYSACFQCQYHINKECTNEGECIWKELEKELKALEEHNEILNYYGLTLADFREACLLLVQWRGANTCFCDIEKQKKALEIIINKGVFVHLLQQSRNVEEYNSHMIIIFKKMAEKDYKGTVKKFCLTETEFNLIKEYMSN